MKNENIICISSIDWDFIWQGHQEIMSSLAASGNRVLFIENTGVRVPGIRDIPRIKMRIKNWLKGTAGIRQERENLYVFSPVVLPFPYFRLARFINRRFLLSVVLKWMKVMDFTDPIIWTFLPNAISLDFINSIIIKKAVIYYCIDNFAVSSPSAKKIRRTEIKLIKQADLVFVTSHSLFEYCSEFNRNVHIFPFGVNIGRFLQIRDDSPENNEVAFKFNNIKHPIIGYCGGLHKWVDQQLLASLSAQNPDYSFVFAGPIQTDVSKLRRFDNVFFLGPQPHDQLPYIILQYDVCIIPYLLTEYTKNVYPTKLNEYLAMGKPVISTALPEIEYFNKFYNELVYIAKDAKEFSKHIKHSLKSDTNVVARRIDAARENSWQKRIEQMNILIKKQIELNMDDKQKRWKENLLKAYRTIKKKVVYSFTICIILYLGLFKTPLIWIIAEPLKVTNVPQKADAIVVFAGGVGESGFAGQGFEERVTYAVNLYKQSYAPYLIFSSGYTYLLEETKMMKLLAVNLGVPGKNIYLEKQAINSYENVKFSGLIIEHKNFKSIILVSSPYHMLRANLVFRKLFPNLKVVSCPIPDSIFYKRIDGVSPYQIKAIIHEYLGIIYYWLKGWV